MIDLGSVSPMYLSVVIFSYHLSPTWKSLTPTSKIHDTMITKLRLLIPCSHQFTPYMSKSVGCCSRK